MTTKTTGKYSLKSITLEEILSRLSFNPDTGKFTRIRKTHLSKDEPDGTVLLRRDRYGNKNALSYSMWFRGVGFSVLWLAWFVTHGKPPESNYLVIPKNGDYKDARPENLELLLKNEHYHLHVIRSKYSSSRDLPPGVAKHRKKYTATIQGRKNKNEYLGLFDTAEEASKMYQTVAEELYRTGSCYVTLKDKGKLITLE